MGVIMDTWKHRTYVYILAVFALCFYSILFRMFAFETEMLDIIFWSILGIIAETFYIILPNDAATSVGMAVYLAALVSANPLVAVTASIMAFIFRMPVDEGKRHHLFTYHYTIVIYNVAAHVVFVGVMGYLYYILYGYDDISPNIILIALFLLSLSELISIILISFYFYTRTGEQRIPLIKSFLGALPSTWAVGALGIILALAHIYYGKSVVVLFFIPLLFARYSFKLYFDSQKTGQETIEALNATLHYRDAYTAIHTERVEIYTLILAKAMGYVGKDLERIKKAARLHDVGKIGVPDGILNKPGKLSDEEFRRIKDHAAMGAQILSNVDSLKKITEIVRQHHERPDGKGYPDGLKGDAISLDASMLSIADTFDAMTSRRPYSNAKTKEYAFSELRKYRGTQFRADLVEVFIDAYNTYEASQPDQINEEVEAKQQVEERVKKLIEHENTGVVVYDS